MGQPGHIDMDTAATSDAISLIAAAGQRMADGWRSASSEINGLVGQLGRGELGAAFLDGYQQPAAETASVVDRCCQVPGRFAEAGNRCIAVYESADSRSRNNFDSINAPAPPASSQLP
jgi:hypothetical protein